MQLLLKIPENSFDIDLPEKERMIIEDMYDLSQEDNYEIANIGSGVGRVASDCFHCGNGSLYCFDHALS